jgi:choline-glycine betaine transporter
MKPSILAIRSIGAEFANRIYFIVAGATFAGMACSLGLTLWLTTLSDWWWLLFAVLVIVLSVVGGVLIIIKLVIRSVTPHQTRSQKKQTKAFVDKLQRLSDTAQTSKFALLFMVVRDIAAPREHGLIATISTDTTSLKRDFAALSRTFK